MQAFDRSVKLLQNVIFRYFETDFCGPINSEISVSWIGGLLHHILLKKFP
jgi:hypothetical protein